MNRPVRFSHFKGLERAHFETARGTPQQASDYASKVDTRIDGPYIFGTISKGQGSREDIIGVRDAIKEGKSDMDIFDDDNLINAACRFYRGMEKMRVLYTPPIDRSNIKVTLHYGPSGTGKTACCYTPDAYFYDGHNDFWIGYNGQSKVILDEFGGHTMSPLMFQRVLDRYPFTANIKGGSINFNGTDIHITSNYLPNNWWKEGTKYNQDAVYRRIHEVHYHDKIKHYHKFVSDENSNAMEKLIEFVHTSINYIH